MRKSIVLLLSQIVLYSLIGGCSGSPADVKKSDDSGVQFSKLSELNNMIPASSYKITPYDLLEIKVLQAEELSQEVRVNPNGYISLPLVGDIKAAGQTQDQLKRQLTIKLAAKYLQDPQVSIFIKEFTNQRVTVDGDVKRAGVFPITGTMTVLQAIAQAGGLNDMAKPTQVVLFRRQPNNTVKAYLLNLKDIRRGAAKDPFLQNEDKIVVQRSGTRQWLKDIRINLPFYGATK